MNDLASSISPIVGGILSVISFFFPFYVLSVTSFIAFLVVSFRLKFVPRPKKASLEHQMSTLSRHMRDMRFVKTVFLIVTFYALINVYYSFLSVFLNDEGLSIPLIGVIMTVALFPAVALEVPIGHVLDKYGIRKMLSIAVLLTTATAILIPLSNDFYYAIVVVTAFTICYTVIFIALYSRMSDVMRKDKIAMTGAIATFKDLGYTIGPLLAGTLIAFIGMGSTLLITGTAFILLLPVTLTLHD
jgi:predicted MFS family arabinose efflux permease